MWEVLEFMEDLDLWTHTEEEVEETVGEVIVRTMWKNCIITIVR